MMIAAFLWGARRGVLFAGFANDVWGVVHRSVRRRRVRRGVERRAHRAVHRGDLQVPRHRRAVADRPTRVRRPHGRLRLRRPDRPRLRRRRGHLLLHVRVRRRHRGRARRLLRPRHRVRSVRPRDVHGHRRHRFRLLRDAATANKSLAKRLAVAGGLLLLAMAAHFIWNSPTPPQPAILLYGVIKGLPFLIGLGILLYLARRRENEDLELILADEVGRPGLLPAELAALRESTLAPCRREARQEGGRGRRPRQVTQGAAARADPTGTARVSGRVTRRRLIAPAHDSGWRDCAARLWQFPGAAAALGVDEATAAAPPIPAHLEQAFRADRTVASSGGWAWATPNPDRSAPDSAGARVFSCRSWRIAAAGCSSAPRAAGPAGPATRIWLGCTRAEGSPAMGTKGPRRSRYRRRQR